MDKYEYRLKAEQIEKLVERQDYTAAAKIADSIDWRRVKNLNMLLLVSETYEALERYEDCMEILNIAYEREPVGRTRLYKMTEIATKMHDFDNAIGLYREFVRSAPHDQRKYILKYQIYRARGSSVEDQILVLQDYKSHEYQEKWIYELASLYAEAGYEQECVRECDELALYSSEGEYVIKAMELKMHFAPLTAAQQEKYDYSRGIPPRREPPVDFHGNSSGNFRENEKDFEEMEVTFNVGEFSTMNLEAELVPGVGEMILENASIQMSELKLEEAPEILPEIDFEQFSPQQVLEKEEPEAEALPDFGLEELVVSSQEPEAEALPDFGLEELAVSSQETGILPELKLEEWRVPEGTGILPELMLEELHVPEERLAEAEPEETCVPATAVFMEKKTEEGPLPPEPEKTEDALIDKQITGQLTIDDILNAYQNQKVEEEAFPAEEEEESEQERREQVKQETAELVKLISGNTEALPEEVRKFLAEMPEEALVTEDDLPQDLDEDLYEEAPVIEPVEAVKKPALRETPPVSMIQALESDLAAEVSEMAVTAGYLTKEQARLFSYFTSIKGMSQQLSLLFKDEEWKERRSSSGGNLVITGGPGNGKTTLAIAIVKALQKQKLIEGKRLAKVSGQKMNSKDIHEVLSKFKGGVLIIESAGGLSEASILAMSLAMETGMGGLLVILEDSAEEIQRIFLNNKHFASQFDKTIDIPALSNDELVAFGKSYALELDYAFDEFAVLALYDKIGSRQTNDHAVSVAEVKEMVDSAVVHSEKGGMRHLFARMTKKDVDEFGKRLLREDDFDEA